MLWAANPGRKPAFRPAGPVENGSAGWNPAPHWNRDFV